MRYLDFVNTKMGTDSQIDFSRGNTLPLCQLPFGMCAFCPQTQMPKDTPTWFYSPSSQGIEGVRLTHQPSPWIGDYATFLFSVSKKESRPTKKAISISRLAPHFQEFLYEDGSYLKVTPTLRGGNIIAKGEYLSFYGILGNTSFEFNDNILYITNDYTEKSDSKSFLCHASIKFDSEIKEITIEDGACHIKIDKSLSLSLAISYISRQMSLLELSRQGTFEKTLDLAESTWEKYLSKIEIESENATQLTVFYSCMYRAFLFPHIAHEIDKDKKAVHYSPFLGKVMDGVRYTDYGFWDTYRTSIPLFAIIAKEELCDMMQGFLNHYKESGFLPRWTSLGEIGCMPSTLIDGAICEASVRGVLPRALEEELLFAMVFHAKNPSSDERYGRKCITDYIKYGYVPYNKSHESVNLSLDFAYGDWCIGTIAKKLGKNELASEFFDRARRWETLFDKDLGFVVAKDESGRPRKEFDPLVWGYDYTESGAYQNIFGAPHALDRVASLLGGNKNALLALDRIFETPPDFKIGRYGYEIHEMTEMAKAPVGLGQCAISNQPSFSLPFLYSYFGDIKKSNYYVEKIARECFSPDSYPGDEDNGSMSAWYIFATLGFYPICPGKKEYAKTKPLAKYKINA